MSNASMPARDPIRLDQTTRAAVASGRLVHLATINPDGTPQVTCIYVGWDEDDIVAGHLADHVKLRNIRRDPRVTLSVESDVPFEGFSPYLVIQGIARVEEGGAVPLLRRITNGQFPPPGDDWPEGFVTRISPRTAFWYWSLGHGRLRPADEARLAHLIALFLLQRLLLHGRLPGRDRGQPSRAARANRGARRRPIRQAPRRGHGFVADGARTGASFSDAGRPLGP